MVLDQKTAYGTVYSGTEERNNHRRAAVRNILLIEITSRRSPNYFIKLTGVSLLKTEWNCFFAWSANALV